MSDRADEWITQREAARVLGLAGMSGSYIPKLVAKGLLHPRGKRPSLSRREVEHLRDARMAAARERELLRQPNEPSPLVPPDSHPDWVLAAPLAAEMGVGGPWVVHQRARRGRLPYVVDESGRRWFRRDLVQMAVRAQTASRSKRLDA